MSTSLQSITGAPGTNALFQDFVTKVDTALVGFGLVNTADTGQIDPATVAKPSSSADAGFRVYSTNDGLTTWYLKLTFGLASTGTVRITVQVGTATNGAGTLSGQTSTSTVVSAGGSASFPTGTTNLAMSGDAGRVMVMAGNLVSGGLAVSWAFAIGRNVDTAGAVADGGLECYYAYSGAFARQYIPKTGTVPAQDTGGWPVVFPTTATSVIGSNVRFGHPMLWDESNTNNPTPNVGVWAKNDFTPSSATTITVSLYGSTRTFMLMGDHQNSAPLVGNQINSRTMWRYD